MILTTYCRDVHLRARAFTNRQDVDGDLKIVSEVTGSGSDQAVGGLAGHLAQALDRGDGVKGSGDDLAGPGTLRLVGQAAFEQFGVGENDAQLIVQPVEQSQQFGLTRRIGRDSGGETGPQIRRHD